MKRKLVQSIVKFCRNTIIYFEKAEEKQFKFNKLTSNKNLDLEQENKSFKDALDFAIQDDEIKNIAITGNYGSGKSSLVDTYENKYTNKRFIHISLAEYSNDSSVDENEMSTRQLNIVEGKIINQLLHQINPKFVKKSVFKTLRPVSILNSIFITLYIFMLLLLVFYFANNSFWEKLVQQISFLKFILNTQFYFYSLILLLVLMIFGMFKAVTYIIENKAIKKITFGGKNITSDIEIFSDQSIRVSYFDRYLDDVLFLLHQSKADVIVFEDLDRFNDNSIFEKIKELNILINKKLKISYKKNKKIIFLYLLKDDMFISKERTKFFDFIIPVVPVITNSNSNDKLTKVLEEMQIKSGLSEEFLFKTSLYIDDMRLLYNICNEYYLYKLELCSEENSDKFIGLDSEKIFAIIVYKNIFPKDFSKLQNNQGFLYSIFKNKEEFRKNELNEIDNEIQKLEEQIRNFKLENKKNEIELYGTIFKIPNGKRVISVNEKFQHEFDSYYDFIYEILQPNNQILSYKTFNEAENNRYYSGVIESIESVFPSKNSSHFKERLKIIKNRPTLDSLNNEINLLNQKRMKLVTQTISNFISNENIRNLASNIKFSYLIDNPNIDIFYFFIKNSYIDETYPDYLSYFYGNVLTKNDKKFLRNIISGIKTSYDFDLVNISEVNVRLTQNDFTTPEILNYGLFIYLLRHPEQQNQNEKISLILDQNQNIDFLIGLASNLYEKESKFFDIKLFVIFMEKWLKINPKRFSEYINLEEAKYQTPLKNVLIRELMNHMDLANIDDILKQQIANYINNNIDVISHDYEYLENFSSNLKKVNINFNDFSTFGEPNDSSFRTKSFIHVINFIFTNNLYQLNSNNLRFFTWWFKGDEYFSEFDFKHKNFELVHKNSNYKPLLNYISQNIDDYFYAYLDICDKKILDNNEFILKLLTNNFLYRRAQDEILLPELLIEYIPKQSLNWSKEDFIHLEPQDYKLLVSDLVQKEKVVASTDVIVSYFQLEKNVDKHLINLINNSKDFNFDILVLNNLSETEKHNFLAQIIKSNDIKDNKYILFLKNSNLKFDVFEFEDISISKVKILVNLEIIQFSKYNIEFLRKEYPNSIFYFIIRHLDKYLEIEKEIHDEKELLALLSLSELSIKEKLKIADHLHTISIIGKSYSDDLIVHILKNQFKWDELSYIISKEFYDFSSNNVKNNIELLAHENIETISTEYFDVISSKLICKLIKDVDNVEKIKLLLYNHYVYGTEISNKDRIKNYIKYIDLFDLKQNINALKEFDAYKTWEKVIFELDKPGYRFKLVNYSPLNSAFANYLDKNDFVSSCSEKNGKIRINGFTEKKILN